MGIVFLAFGIIRVFAGLQLDKKQFRIFHTHLLIKLLAFFIQVDQQYIIFLCHIPHQLCIDIMCAFYVTGCVKLPACHRGKQEGVHFFLPGFGYIAQQVGQFQRNRRRFGRFHPRQRIDIVDGIEQKMRVYLSFQRPQFGIQFFTAQDFFPQLQFLLLSQFIIFILGWPLEWTEIIVIFMPIFIPLLDNFGVDPLFFGLLVALNLQTAFLSPPVAMAAFYLKGVSPPHVTLNQIFAGMLPFMGIQVIAIFLLYVFPQIGLWLPQVLYK